VCGASVGASDGAGLRRLIGAGIAVVAAAVLGVAAWLEPSPTGIGTHAQLNLPTCGWITLMDLPSPTCGMTTAFAHAADGHLLAGFAAQPLGFALAVATAMALLVGTYVAATASRIGVVFASLWGRSTGWWLAGAVVVSWAYKVLAYKLADGGPVGW
jgi:hypothetical protein